MDNTRTRQLAAMNGVEVWAVARVHPGRWVCYLGPVSAALPFSDRIQTVAMGGEKQPRDIAAALFPDLAELPLRYV